MDLTLAFDLGKTRCSVAVYEGSRRITEGQGPGFPGPSSSGSGVVTAVRSALHDVDVSTFTFERVSHVAVGMAGWGMLSRTHAPSIIDGLTKLFAGAELLLASDMTTAHAGAFAAGHGTVVVAGTGSVALAVAPSGRWARSGGSGPILGDEGSALAVGRAGLQLALRAHDMRVGGSAMLLGLARRRYGSVPEGLDEAVYQSENWASAVAAFARDVGEAARQGDVSAAAVLSEAGRELAEAAAAATTAACGADPRRIRETFPVAGLGSLWRVGELLSDPFRARLQELAPFVEVVTPTGSALDGAAALARSASTPLEPLLTRTSYRHTEHTGAAPGKTHLSSADSAPAPGRNP